MGNIVLTRFVIVLYIVVCIVFCLSPYMSGKNKRFGIKVDKKSKSTMLLCALYIVTAVMLSTVLALMCIHKRSFLFVNISVFMYIVFMVLIYFKVKHKLKIMFDKDIFREIILNNPPKTYEIKILNPLWYILYCVPITFNFFIGRDDALYVYLIVIQIIILILSYFLNFVICKLKIYVDENIENSVKNSIKYRKMWNINTFMSLLAVSISITVMYAEYKHVISIGGIGTWLPIAVVVIAVGILFFYTIKHYKK